MTLQERRELYRQKVMDGPGYSLADWSSWDYSTLNDIITLKRKTKRDDRTLNDVYIMADTETSKRHYNATVKKKDGTIKYEPVTNYVVVWTVSIRAYGINLVTLYGRTPSDLARCFDKIHEALPGDDTMIYFHNLSYDWQFIRRFLFQRFAYPEEQLNTKSHYPISIKFKGGLIIRDSLILAQRGLNKWAKDLNVQHQKAVGDWDYDLIRNQDTELSADEMHYAEYDTLAGVECLEAMCKGLKKDLSTIPYTATGIPRDDMKKLAKSNRWRESFLKFVPTYEQYVKLTKVYHGGYTHGNRHDIGRIIRDQVQCRDFASSYPYILTAYKMPMQFAPVDKVTIEEILSLMDDFAFMFRLILIRPRLKDDAVAMPYLQSSKADKTINMVLDNGRILCAEYVSIWLTEYDLAIINDQYEFDSYLITNCEMATKAYMPRWFTDYVYKCFYDKTMLKGGDPVAYSMAKSKINSIYGMCVQHCVRDEIYENYETGEYYIGESVPQDEYEKWKNKHSSIMLYQVGVWVTAIAAYNLFKLGACADDWIYSDTDSCYAYGWDEQKLNQYNESCKQRLRDNGYGPVIRDGREYWLGVAESDGDKDTYTEFRVLGAKRYCGRCKADGQLHITVAGVPKCGAEALKDDITNFDAGIVFPGELTGKKTHMYLYEEISIDAHGNEYADSIDLTPCDYLADIVELQDWQKYFEEEISVEAYAADAYGN